MCQNKTGSTLQPEHPKHGGTSLEGGESEEGITLYQEKEKIYSAIAARGSQ